MQMGKNDVGRLIFELGLIFGIILGRWLMPRGKLTRDQLSALLLGYVGTAADIVGECPWLVARGGTRENHPRMLSNLLIELINKCNFLQSQTKRSEATDSLHKFCVYSLPGSFFGSSLLH